MDTGETAIGYLRRAVENLDYEYESLLMDLPTPAALLEYFALWSVYDTEYLTGILDAIAEGDDPAPYRKFRRKYRLNHWPKG